MDKGSTHDAGTKAQIGVALKESYQNGTRKAPVTKLKEEKQDLQHQLDQMKVEMAALRAEVDALGVWKSSIQSVAARHRELLDKGSQKAGPAGDMCRDLLDVLCD